MGLDLALVRNLKRANDGLDGAIRPVNVWLLNNVGRG
jgi:hypothetical protein